MTVSFRKSFLRDLKKIKGEGIRDRVRAVIEAIEEAGALTDLSNVRKMSGSDGYYRVRVGSYRIGLMLDEAEV